MLEKNSHYIIISAHDSLNDDQVNTILTSKLENTLWSKGYNFQKIFSNNNKVESFIAIKNETDENLNNELRYDCIEFIHEFYQKECIVKYDGEDVVKKILNNGSERELKMINYNEDADYSYYNNGLAFSLVNLQQYFYPKKKSDLKSGMTVEMCNKNKWISRKVENLDLEWDKMYSLLARYNKLRAIKDVKI